LAATTLNADVILPDDVATNEYGDVIESLTGVPGNPERGLEVMFIAGWATASRATRSRSRGISVPRRGRAVARRRRRALGRAALRGIIVNAKAAFPDTVMPSFYRVSGFTRPGNAFTGRAAEGPLDPLLSAQDIEDVVAYLLTLTEY
jgi:sulfur-oxidizing protein SoxX